MKKALELYHLNIFLKKRKGTFTFEEDSCYNSCEEDDDLYEEMKAFDEVEDLYEEMNFEKSGTLAHSSLYMSMVFHRD